MASSESEAENYEVDRILEQRKKGRTTEFLVRWQGFGEEEDSWEPERNLKTAKDAIDLFLAEHKIVTPSRKSRSTTESVGARASRKTTTTTKTTTVTKRLQQRAAGASTQSEDDEGSPVVTRRTTRSEYTSVQEPRQQADSKPSKKAPGGGLTLMRVPGRAEIPIIIFVTCMLVIALSFVIEKKPWA